MTQVTFFTLLIYKINLVDLGVSARIISLLTALLSNVFDEETTLIGGRKGMETLLMEKGPHHCG